MGFANKGDLGDELTSGVLHYVPKRVKVIVVESVGARAGGG